MKKVLALLLILVLFHPAGPAKEIPPKLAAEAARQFMLQVFTTDSLAPARAADIELLFARSAQSAQPDLNQVIPSYYVFGFSGSEGFIIVAADDRVYPILGFSAQSGFEPDRINPALRKWLDEYHRQIQRVIAHDIHASPEIADSWQALLDKQPLKGADGHNSVGPLLQTRWNQSPYINDQCPFDRYRNARTVTGCVATAVAQIMKFWNYPERGTGFHTYQHNEYGALSANFGATRYQWSQMPNLVQAANNAVATLLFHVGVSVEMDYGVDASSASTFEYTEGLHSGEYALKNYFGYRESLYAANRADYTDDQWIRLIRDELNAGRPVLYRGSGSGGGHAFVCDGYTQSSFFHFNWGWGGYQDGYFYMNALNPGDVGTGGGTGGFNSFHMAGIGVQPPAQVTSYDLRLYDQLTADPNPLNYGNAFTAHYDVANFGQSDFNGDFCVALFDAAVNFIDFVEVKTNWDLGSNYHYTDGITFSNQGSFAYLPGTYTLAALYRQTGGNWQLVENNGDFQNLTGFTIQHANDIELYAEMSMNPGPDIIRGRPFNVHLDIANTGTTTFTGTVDVSIYDLEGQFIETIGEINGVTLNAGYHFTNGLDFTSSGLSAEPATYLMALQYHTTAGGWQLAGSSYQTNPVKVIVQAAPIEPDPYENNNSVDAPYVFYPSYTQNRYTFETAGSSIHSAGDDDYYGIYLEQGFTYTLTGRLHDSYNSANEQTYTVDCLVSLIVGDYTSDVYDDVMPAFDITAHGSGLAILHVAPYFEGEEGSYLLEVQVSRKAGTGISPEPVQLDLLAWPNPAQDELFIQLPATRLSASSGRLDILDLTGRTVLTRKLNSQDPEQLIRLNISSLPAGPYTIRVSSGENILKPFIKK